MALDQCVLAQDRRHHRRHRRHRLPDQHPGAERRRGSGARRRTGPRLRGGGIRSAQPGAALGRGGQGNQEPDRRLGGQGRGRQRAGGRGRRTMEEIVDSVKRVTDIMGEIAAASQEQTSGIEQINQAITQMDQVTQQNAALVEEGRGGGRSRCRSRPAACPRSSASSSSTRRRGSPLPTREPSWPESCHSPISIPTSAYPTQVLKKASDEFEEPQDRDAPGHGLFRDAAADGPHRRHRCCGWRTWAIPPRTWSRRAGQGAAGQRVVARAERDARANLRHGQGRRSGDRGILQQGAGRRHGAHQPGAEEARGAADLAGGEEALRGSRRGPPGPAGDLGHLAKFKAAGDRDAANNVVNTTFPPWSAYEGASTSSPRTSASRSTSLRRASRTSTGPAGS